MNDNNHKRPADIMANRILRSFQKDFFVIGKERVTAWPAWLIIGVMTGVVIGLISVATRTGEFEKTQAKSPPSAISTGAVSLAGGGGQVPQEQPLASLNEKFRQVAVRWKSTTGVSGKSQSSQELKNVVLQRNSAMLSLMESDPLAANQVALKEEDAAGLPPGLRSKIEGQIEVEGTLEILHTDNFDEPDKSTFQFFLKDKSGKVYTVHFPQTSPPLVSSSKIRVKGIELGGVIATLGESDGGVVVLAEAVAAPEAENAVVLLVNFLDNTSQPWTVATVNDVIFNKTASYYTENSFSKRTLTGDIFGYYTLPINKTCDIWVIKDAAIKASDADILFPNYTQFIFAGPFSGCGWAGVAYVGDVGNSTSDGFVSAGNSWIASMTTHIVGHELGHTFGVWHANFYNCGVETFKDTGCSSQEYGDGFDIMGLGAAGHMNAYHKEKLNFFDASNVVQVSSSGSYTINPIENTTTAPQILKLSRGSGIFTYVEYRQPLGVDSVFSSTVLDGAMFHIAPWFFGQGETQLLDMTPTSPSSKSDVTLEVGKSFLDAGIATITPTNQSASGLTVDIAMFPPSVDVKVNSSDGPLSDGPLSLAAPTSYMVRWTSNSSTCTKSGSWSGSVGSSGNQLFKDVLTAGTYTHTVTCSNSEGSTSDSVTVTVTEPTLPPVVDIKAAGSDGPVTLTAPASFSVQWSANYATGGCTNSGDWTGFAYSSYGQFFSSMPIGTYTYNVTCSNALGTASDSVVVNVVAPDTTPPVVSVTSPASGAVVSGTTTVSIDATDASGVFEVALHVDGVIEAFLLTSPYVYNWDTKKVSNGSHALTASAYDSFSNYGTSSPITVTVDNFIDTTPPVTSITSPTDGSTVSGTVTISASASDNVAVATVEFLLDGVLLGTDTLAPYSFAWDTTKASNGSHTLKSRATDTSANTGESATVSVIVSNVIVDTTPPTVSITNPTNGSIIKKNSTVTITASASDNVGVTKVEFYVNGSLKCTDTVLPHGCAWKVPAKKNAVYTIQAKAYDAAGNSAVHSISVKAQ